MDSLDAGAIWGVVLAADAGVGAEAGTTIGGDAVLTELTGAPAAHEIARLYF